MLRFGYGPTPGIIIDPMRQFRLVRDRFQVYPTDVLVRKLKYRWMLAWYWAIRCLPANPRAMTSFFLLRRPLLNA